MRGGALRKTLLILGGFVAFAYLVIGIVGALWPGHWDEASAADEIIWDTLLIGGGVAVAVGLWLIDKSPWTGAAFVSIGSVAGGIAIFWALLPVLVAVALVVLSVVYARRRTAHAT